MILCMQQAQARWVQDEDDNQWGLYDPDNNLLGRLPASLKDFEVMAVIRLCREYELKAYNDGVAEGLERGAKATQANRAMAVARITSLEEMNNALAEQLERHITGEEIE